MADRIERLKWRIAYLLNRFFHRRVCWADMVSWVLDTKRTRDKGLRAALPWRPIGKSCRDDLARCGACYCGKLMSAEVREQVHRG
jgi:hypothetical protein